MTKLELIGYSYRDQAGDEVIFGYLSPVADIYVDLDAIKEEPLKYFITVHEQLRTDAYRDYTLDQIKGLEVSVDEAYKHLSDLERPHFMNERIMILLGIADLKKEKGYVTTLEEKEEPETKR